MRWISLEGIRGVIPIILCPCHWSGGFDFCVLEGHADSKALAIRETNYGNKSNLQFCALRFSCSVSLNPI